MPFSAHSLLDYRHLLGSTISCKLPPPLFYFLPLLLFLPSVKRTSHSLVGALIILYNFSLAPMPNYFTSTDFDPLLRLPLFEMLQFPTWPLGVLALLFSETLFSYTDSDVVRCRCGKSFDKLLISQFKSTLFSLSFA